MFVWTEDVKNPLFDWKNSGKTFSQKSQSYCSNMEKQLLILFRIRFHLEKRDRACISWKTLIFFPARNRNLQTPTRKQLCLVEHFFNGIFSSRRVFKTRGMFVCMLLCLRQWCRTFFWLPNRNIILFWLKQPLCGCPCKISCNSRPQTKCCAALEKVYRSIVVVDITCEVFMHIGEFSREPWVRVANKLKVYPITRP